MNEDGFSLIELVASVAVLAIGCVLALAVLPALFRQSESGLLHAAAFTLAENQLTRARAAAAYVPAGAATGNHAWALAPADNAAESVRVHRGWCATGRATTDVPMTMTSSYDQSADTLTVTVAYPHTPCGGTAQDRVTLAAQLAPPQYAPQTILQAPLLDPATQ